MTSKQLEFRKQQDDIVMRKLAIVPLRFESNGKEMMYCYLDSQHELAGWILCRHPDGQWVTLRKATEQDIMVLSIGVSNAWRIKMIPCNEIIWLDKERRINTYCKRESGHTGKHNTVNKEPQEEKKEAKKVD